MLCWAAPAQTGINLQWEKEFTNLAGARNMNWNAILPYASGVVVAGQSSWEFGLAMYLARYQANGQLLWDSTLTTPGSSSLRQLAADNLGNLYVTGAESIGGSGQLQVHVWKFSPGGQVIWHTTYRGPADLYAQATDMKLVGGHLYLCGQQQTSANWPVAWVAKFDLDGNLVWENAFDPGFDTYLFSLAVDAAGTVTAVGSANDGFSFLALQYDSNGNLNWQYPASLSSGLTQGLSEVVADNLGHVYAVGTRESGVFEADIITLKLGPGGNKIWKKNFNNQTQSEGRNIRLAPDGTLYTLGNISNAAFALAIHYDTAGSVVWTRSFQLGNSPYLADAVVDASGDVFLAVEDFDSVGVARITAAGALASSRAYGLEQANYIGGIALSGGSLFAAGYGGAGNRATLLGFQPASLQQNLLVEAFGTAQSDARPGAITADGSHAWLSTFSDDGDSAVFAVTQMDASGNFVWEQSLKYATVISDYPYLTHDGAGNVIGLFQNSRNVDGGQLGLVKYDAAGASLFTTLIGSGSSNDLLRAGGLALDPSGDIFLATYHSPLREMRLSRYDPAGAHQWTVSYQSPSTIPVSVPYHMQRTPQGKLVIAALHRGLSNDNELHLFQYAANGTLEWQADVAAQAGNLTSFAGMNVLDNGDIIAFGSSAVAQYAAARFSSTGALMWSHSGANPFSAASRSVAVDAQGQTYLCFSTNSHVYIRQLDATGNLIREGQISTPTTGSFYIPWHATLVGDRLAILGEHQLAAGLSVPFRMLLDNQLNPEYIQVDSTTRGQIQAMTVAPDGTLYGAYLTGNLTTSGGARGALVRRYGIGTVGIDPDQWTGIKTLRLYPNPAQETLHLEMEAPQAGAYHVFICDVQGQFLETLARQPLQAGPAKVEVALPPHLAGGIYLIGIAGAGGTVFRKLVLRP